MAYDPIMPRSPASSGLLPLPGSPASSWPMYRARFMSLFQGAESSVVAAFWLFGLINNVCYVIILSAAVDLVGSKVPKGVVLLADVLPSFLTKLIAPYFIQKVPYSVRIIVMCALAAAGMFLIALSPAVLANGSGIITKLFGVAMASLASGGGELSFLGLTHFYGPFALAAWGSGTGGAGLVGAGLYVLLTSTLGLTVKTSLLVSAFLPFIMPITFFLVLPHGPLRRAHPQNNKSYKRLAVDDEDRRALPVDAATEALLTPSPSLAAEAYASHSQQPSSSISSKEPTLWENLHRARSLFFPYMLPLLIVYIAEYTINLALLPLTLFPLSPAHPYNPPFETYRQFYPLYSFLYQIGVFISRSSTPFIRLPLYPPSLFQLLNLLLILIHTLHPFIPNVWILFILIFWEGLLGGAVYVNTFASIMEEVGEGEREFSLGAVSVADSGGICIAGFIGIAIEGSLCEWNVQRGRPWCGLVGGGGK